MARLASLQHLADLTGHWLRVEHYDGEFTRHKHPIKDGRYVFTMLYFAQNVGVVVGTALVGFVYDISITLLFLIAVVLYGIFFGIVLIKFRPAAKTAQPTRKETTTETPKPSLPSANKLMLTTFFLPCSSFGSCINNGHPICPST